MTVHFGGSSPGRSAEPAGHLVQGLPLPLHAHPLGCQGLLLGHKDPLLSCWDGLLLSFMLLRLEMIHRFIIVRQLGIVH